MIEEGKIRTEVGVHRDVCMGFNLDPSIEIKGRVRRYGESRCLVSIWLGGGSLWYDGSRTLAPPCAMAGQPLRGRERERMCVMEWQLSCPNSFFHQIVGEKSSTKFSLVTYQPFQCFSYIRWGHCCWTKFHAPIYYYIVVSHIHSSLEKKKRERKKGNIFFHCTGEFISRKIEKCWKRSFWILTSRLPCPNRENDT